MHTHIKKDAAANISLFAAASFYAFDLSYLLIVQAALQTGSWRGVGYADSKNVGADDIRPYILRQIRCNDYCKLYCYFRVFPPHQSACADSFPSRGSRGVGDAAPYVLRPGGRGVIKVETRCFPLEIASRLCRENALRRARAILTFRLPLLLGDE
jgi:hypothetical protein